MARDVTGLELEMRTVTIDVPHADLLVEIGKVLARWQEEIDRLSGEMARLQDAGVFLDENGTPVVPGWWERKENGHHAAWYLVWPRRYVRKTGRKRRQYVKVSDYEPTKAKVQRTLEYAELQLRLNRLTRQIEETGQDLTKLAERYGW